MAYNYGVAQPSPTLRYFNGSDDGWIVGAPRYVTNEVICRPQNVVRDKIRWTTNV